MEFDNLGTKNLEFEIFFLNPKKSWKFELKSLKKLDKPGIFNNFIMLSN